VIGGVLAPGRAAVAQDVMALVRADRWPEAEAAAGGYADPVVRKLVLYYRLLAPGAASVGEISEFMAGSPDWPLQGSLARRRDAALAMEPDDQVVMAACDAGDAIGDAALAHCAEAYQRAGRAAAAAGFAARAWVAAPADAVLEASLLARFGGMLTGADQWRRFDRLAWSNTAEAARQEARLDPGDRQRAEARLALRRDDPGALGLVAALPEAQQREPALVLEQARWLRRGNQDAAAVALWTSVGTAAERAAPADRKPAFWDERNILIRRRLRDGDAAGAYALADGHAQAGGEALVDAEFLAGFVALRRLDDPIGAARHFQTLADASGAAITQGRAHYWLGRAAEARHDAATAKREYAAAAAWPDTFYGQLAAMRGGEGPAALAARITDTADPPADGRQALDLAGRELARAAAYLVSWGEARRAEPFLLRLDDIAPDPADRTLAARLSTGFGMPEVAVAIARRAGRDGLMLMQTGWPQPVDIPKASGVEPALALGIIRQESSFDTSTVSPVGARGMMQLMPATAGVVARQIGMPISASALVLDPDANVRLGTAYLRELLDQFAGSVPMAVAAYNAGPNRVQSWVGMNGDPRVAGTDMIDWIELIPFGETRNYVQRVIENEVIYRAKRGEILPPPVGSQANG
jgi:soluble lytic murein transglycosylase